VLPGKQESAPMTTRTLTTIGFDADDTLWQNEQFYRLTETHFTELLADFADGASISDGCWQPRSAISSTTASASRVLPCR
jgi:hypothetical protein